ncbi:hypothetical protein K5X82_17535 [Halosquirtibacter xylanolyticus]|uniref:hypothetical protein n=1 Tax=Halosquirtibacter xylanolyticus TaxID=3374599 RepID=UPI003747D7D7|nr:hypothetical protein K5X82_17535 [Prolixibacteraceae bacterium]
MKRNNQHIKYCIMISKTTRVIPLMTSLFIAIFFSCSSDNYKFDDIDIKDINTNVAAPVAYGKFTLWDFIEGNDSENIIKKDDGTLWFTYSENDVIEYNLQELYGFPQQMSIGDFNINIPAIPNPTGLPIPIPPLALNKKVAIITSTVENSTLKLFEANIKSGSLNVAITNPMLDLDANLKVRFKDASKSTGGVITPLEFDIIAIPGTNSYQLPINNATLNFENELNKDQLTIELLLSFDGNINSSLDATSFATSISITDLDFGYIKTDLGSHDIDFDKQVFDIDIDALDEIGSGILFTNPTITLTTKTNIVADCYISPLIEGVDNDMTKIDLNAPSYMIPTPDRSSIDPTNFKVGNYIVNKDNSNIVNFMGLPPSRQITFEGHVSINKDLNGTVISVTKENPNIIFPNSAFSANFKMETPFQFKAQNLSYSDTIDLSDEIEYINNASLILKYEHEIPFEIAAILQPYSSQSKQNIGAPISFPPIISAKVDESGHPIEIVKGDSTLKLTETDIENINLTDQIIIKLMIDTKDDDKAFLNGNQTINIELAVDANATIEN